jgi:hypothetical protein
MEYCHKLYKFIAALVVMLFLNWPLVISITVFLYSLILLFFPFSTAAASTVLLVLIGFWSRLPGVGFMSPFQLLHIADMVDFICIIIAINIGGVQAAVISVFLNLSSRLCGITPGWILVLKDTIAQFAVCLIIPFIHIVTGESILMTIVWYSLLRLIMFFPIRFITPPINPFPQFVINMIIGAFLLFLVNITYAKIFGWAFESMLGTQAGFNWLIFLIATVVILIFYTSVFGFSKSIKISDSLKDTVKRVMRKNYVKSKRC